MPVTFTPVVDTVMVPPELFVMMPPELLSMAINPDVGFNTVMVPELVRDPSLVI